MATRLDTTHSLSTILRIATFCGVWRIGEYADKEYTMRDDDIVTCTYCRDGILFADCYVTRNGNRPDTYECRDEVACLTRMTEYGFTAPITLAPDVWY